MGIPIDPNSAFICRRKKWEIDLNDLTLFCEHFKGVGEESLHCLGGGEPTILTEEKFDQVIDVLSSYNRRIELFTNGYNIMGISKATINKIAKIKIDDHGINHSHIQDCIRYLKSFYKGTLQLVRMTSHYDTEASRRHPSNRGKRCRFLIRNPILWGTTIYPCCSLPFLMIHDNNTIMKDELTKAGWTINNLEILDIMKNWRKTIPDYVKNKCLNDCYFPNANVGGLIKITLKNIDVIKKG